MAASVGRSKILTSRANFGKYLLNRNVSVTATGVSGHLKGLGLALDQKNNQSLASKVVNNLYPTSNVRFQRSSQTTDYVCWNCNHIHSTYAHICEKCNFLQELQEGLTHFEVMGVPKGFVVDTVLLTKKFRELQSRFHPDKFTKKSEKEKRLSEQHSSAVNKAYSTLLKPIPRGHYLLKLNGASLEESEIEMDPDFLMQIMETNEAVFVAHSLDDVREIDDKNKLIIDDLIIKVSNCFDQGDILKAKETLAKLNYYTNIDDKIKELERKNMDYPISR